MTIRVHKIALDPTTGQRRLLAQHAGYARFAWNDALRAFKRGLDNGIFWRDAQLRPDWNKRKREVAPWCDGLSQNAAKNAVRNLDVAIGKWLDSKLPNGFPAFKKRSHRQSYQADNGVATIQVSGKRVKLPAIGWVRMRETMRFPGVIRGAVVSRTAQRWFVALSVEDGETAPAPYEASEAIGVDVGIKSLAVTSDGVEHANPKALCAAQRKLRRVQKSIARSRKATAGKPASNRQRRRKEFLARVHARVANVRADAQHKASTTIAREAASTGRAVVAETLNVSGMLQNRRLARAVSDAGIATFLTMLAYKCAALGVPFTRASQWFASSKTCSGCGRTQPMPLSVRTYRCSDCGLVLDRDLNAARNLAALWPQIVAGRCPDTLNGRGGVTPVRSPCEASTQAAICSV